MRNPLSTFSSQELIFAKSKIVISISHPITATELKELLGMPGPEKIRGTPSVTCYFNYTTALLVMLNMCLGSCGKFLKSDPSAFPITPLDL